MNQIIAYSQVLLIVVLLLLLLLWKKYGARSIIHPFAIFLITWVPTFIVIPFYAAINYNRYFFDEQAVIQLFDFFSFTLISMYFSMKIIPINAKNRKLDIDIYAPKELLKWLVLLLFFINIINIFLTRGADLVENRLASVEMAVQMKEAGTAPLLYSVFAILNSLQIPVLILSGKEITSKLAYGINYRLPFWVALIFITIVINTVTGGGRSAIISSFIILILGAMLFYNFQAPIKLVAIKGIIIIAMGFSIFAAYSTFVAESRSSKSGSQITYLFDNPALTFLNGVMSYSFSHIWGYQFRMNDSFSEEPNGFGGDTFGFLTNLNLPFASQIGINNNLGSVLGVEKIPRQEATAYEGITATVYFNLHDDLGYGGTFFAIFFFSIFSQYLFKWVVTHRFRHITSLAVFVFVYGVWRDSWFHHFLGNINLISVFVPYFIFDFFAMVYKIEKKGRVAPTSTVHSDGLRTSPTVALGVPDVFSSGDDYEAEKSPPPRPGRAA